MRNHASSATYWRPGEPGGPSVRHAVTEKFEGEFLPDSPWDFPPGSSGASGEIPDPYFVQWLTAHDPLMVVTWQPVAKHFVIWRKNATGWACVMPCTNPFDFEWGGLQPGDPIPLDNRMKALLIDSDPATYGGEKEMYRYCAERVKNNEQARLDTALDAMRQARDDARRHTRISSGYGAKSKDKYSRMYR